MERYYTIPIEVGLAATPGVDIIRSTSFYGLSFVRVTFQYGVDYYFALTQTAINLQQNVSLPNNVTPQIQGTSLVGEIYRYQVVGPPHFGLTNLRTVQDWVLQRRLLTVPGVVQVNTWGGTTKEFEVEVDLQQARRLQRHPAPGDQRDRQRQHQCRRPHDQYRPAVGEYPRRRSDRQRRRRRPDPRLQGRGHRERPACRRSNGVPVMVKDVAKVSVGYVPRLGKAGRDNEDDVVAAIVVMNRTLHTNDVVARVKAEVEKINSDGTLPPGVKLVPFYDRTTLVTVTTSTVLHNLIFGCLLVFFIQWVFLGDLRSAIIVGANIPFALFFSIIILVLRGEDANLLSVGAVDFGIIVDAAVILVENIYRNFQITAGGKAALLAQSRRGAVGSRSHAHVRSVESAPAWTDRLRLILISALQIDRAVFFSTAIIVAAFIPLFTMQGVEGQIFSPMARTYGYALVGALLATFTVTPCLASLLLPEHVAEVGNDRRARIALGSTRRCCAGRSQHRKITIAIGVSLSRRSGVFGLSAGQRIPAGARGRQSVDPRHHAADHIAGSRHADRQQDPGNPAAPSGGHHRRLPARPSGQRQRRGGLLQCGIFRAAEAVRRMAAGHDQGEADRRSCRRNSPRNSSASASTSRNTSRTTSRRGSPASKAPTRSRSSAPIWRSLEQLAERVAMREMAKVQGDHRSRRLPGARPAQPEHQGRSRQGRALRPERQRRQHASFKPRSAGRWRPRSWKPTANSASTVRLAPEYRNSIDAVRNIKVGVSDVPTAIAYIPLSELASITLDTGASYIFRERNQRFVPIKFSVRGRDLAGAGRGSAGADRTEREAADRLSDRLGRRVRRAAAGEETAGDHRADHASSSSSCCSTACSIRCATACWLLLGIPFAVCGGILALYVSGLDFSISAAIGFISLFGVSVMSGILIINYLPRVAAAGMSRSRPCSTPSNSRCGRC